MSDNYEPTIGYNNTDGDIDRTIAYTDEMEMPGGRTFQPGETLEAGGKSYTIKENLSLKRMSGEAVVYRVEEEGGRELALKMYYRFSNPAEEPNAEALRRIMKINDPDILKIHAFGTGNKKYKNEKCYEICQYAPGGDLLNVPEAQFHRKYSPDFVEREVVPQICKGIAVLHRNKIFHGDLKPQNVFYLDTEQTDLVIGDYGSAKTYSKSSHKNLAFTFLAKGTSFYLAPEQARGIISEKNDYYSLGMILVHLLYPQFVNQETLVKIIERQFAKKPIIDFDPAFGRINDLIAGLTLQEISQRWGKPEVDRWLAGESPSIAYASVAPIKLGGTTLRNPDDLFRFMDSNPDWYLDLIDDRQGFNLLLDWIIRLQDLSHKREFEMMVTFYKKQSRIYCEKAVRRYFKPARPVSAGAQKIDFFAGKDPLEQVRSFFRVIDDELHTIPLETARSMLLDLEYCLRHLARTSQEQTRQRVKIILDKIAAALHLQSSRSSGLLYKFHSSLSFENLPGLLDAFLPDRIFRDENGKRIENRESLGLFLARDPGRYKDPRYAKDLKKLAEKFHLGSFKTLSFKETLYLCLEKHAEISLHFTDAHLWSPDLDTPARYVVTFNITRSLSEYLKSIGINPDIMGRQKHGKQQKKQHREKSFTQTDMKIELDDGDDKKIITDFHSELQEKFLAAPEMDIPVTPASKEAFDGILLTNIAKLRGEREAAEKQRSRDRKRRFLKGAVVTPLALMPVLLCILLFSGEILGILPVKRLLRSLYPIGHITADIAYAGLWHTILLYINWNLLYIFAALPAAGLYFVLEKDRNLRRAMLWANIPPIGWVGLAIGASLIFGLGVPIFFLLGAILGSVTVAAIIICTLLQLGILKKTIYLLHDYCRSAFGHKRRRRQRLNGWHITNYFRSAVMSNGLRFPPLKTAAAALTAAILSAAVLLPAFHQTPVNANAVTAALKKSKATAYTLRLSRFGGYIAGGFSDGTVRRYSTTDGKLLSLIKAHRTPVTAIALNPEGHRIAAGSRGGILTILDNDGLIRKKFWKVRYIHNGMIASLQYDSSGNHLLSAGYNGLIRFWQPEEKWRYAYKYTKGALPAVFSPDRRYLCTGTGYGTVRLQKISFPSTGKRSYRMRQFRYLISPGNEITKAVFTGDSREIACGSADGKILIWAMRKDSSPRTLRGVKSPVTCLKYSSDEQFIAAGHSNGSISIFNAKTGKILEAGLAHNTVVRDIVFTPDSRYLISAGAGGKYELTTVRAGQTAGLTSGGH